MFQVLISPGRAGSENFVLQLMNGDGTLLAVKAAKLVLRKQDGGTEPVAREANLGHDGYWHVENVPIRLAGRWHMWIEAQTMFQRIALEDDFDLPEQ